MEQVKKKIGSNTYMVAPFFAAEALKLQTTLVKILGPGVAKLIGAVPTPQDGKSILESNIDGAEIASAVGTLFEHLGEEEFVSLINRILKNVIVELGTPVKEGTQSIKLVSLSEGENAFNMVFQGKLVDMYKVLFFVIQVNFPDFFELMGKGIGSRFQTILSNQEKVTENPA